MQVQSLQLSSSQIKYLDSEYCSTSPSSIKPHHLYKYNPGNYQNIHDHHFGYLTGDSPVDGLSLHSIQFGMAFVAVCQDTQRSSLTFALGAVEPDRANLVKLFEFLVEGAGQERIQVGAEDDSTKSQNSKGKRIYPVDIELGVFSGSAEHPGSPRRKDDWYEKVMILASTIGKELNIRVSTMFHKELLDLDCLLLEKKTGTVYLPRLPPNGLETPAKLLILPTSAVSPAAIVRQHRSHIERVLKYEICAKKCDLWLQYDGVQELSLPRLSDPGRTLFLLQQAGATKSELVDCAFKMALKNGVGSFSASRWEPIKAPFKALEKIGPSCEVCGISKGDKSVCKALDEESPCFDETCSGGINQICTGCKGAYYCSSEHQKEDWKEHKEWCKKNSVVKLASA